MRWISGCLLMATLAGCSSRPMPIRLQGDPVSIAWLAGSWEGEYWNEASGRHGTIAFSLEGGSDSMYGDVTMADPLGNVIHPVDRPGEHQLHVRSPQLLRIDFVAANADSIRGSLERYTSPLCGCVVSTTFMGRIEGDLLGGTYQTTDGARWHTEGLWRMRRVGAARRSP